MRELFRHKKNTRALLVGDNSDVENIFDRPTIVSRADEAILKIKTAREPFEVLVIDAVLPDSIQTGLDVIEQLREHETRTLKKTHTGFSPATVIARSGAPVHRDVCLKTGADIFEIKTN